MTVLMFWRTQKNQPHHLLHSEAASLSTRVLYWWCWDHGLDHGRYWTKLVTWFEGRRVVSSEGLDQNVLLSFDPDLQRPAKNHRALLHSDVCDPAFSPFPDRGVRLPRQVILFLAERPQQVQMFWVADCHSRVQDQGAHVVFVDHSFHPRDPGHVDLNQNNKLSRPHTDPESTDDQQKQ